MDFVANNKITACNDVQMCFQSSKHSQLEKFGLWMKANFDKIEGFSFQKNCAAAMPKA